jgi:hypothetical protein
MFRKEEKCTQNLVMNIRGGGYNLEIVDVVKRIILKLM